MASADVDDLLFECAICMDKFVEPYVLPCSHTFCRHCLVRHYECSTSDQRLDKNEMISCPACRQTWPLPTGICAGQLALSCVTTKYQFNRRNESISQPSCRVTTDMSLDGEMASSEARHTGVIQCDSCGSQSVEDKRKDELEALAVADTSLITGLRWCVDCSQNLCSNCVDIHGCLTPTKSHCIVPMPLRERDFHGWPCPTHVGQMSDLFCWYCRQLVCTSCTTSPQHRDHSCDDVVSSARRLRTLLQTDATSVDERRQRCDELEAAIIADKNSWMSGVEAADNEIKATADKLRALVDRHCAALRDQLMSTKQLRLKQLQSRIEDLADERNRLISLTENIHAMADSGADVQLLMHAGNLHSSVEQCLSELTAATSLIPHQTVVFVPSNARTWSSEDSLLGRVEVVGNEVSSVTATARALPMISEETGRVRGQQQTLQTPTLYYRQLLTTLDDSDLPVCGLAAVADRLYVCYSHSADVDVYDAGRTSYRRQKSVSVPGLVDPSDMVGTSNSDEVGIRLFISSESDGRVFRVALMAGRDGDVVHTVWLTDDRPYSVSLTGYKHLLVLSREAATVSVLDDSGRQLRRLRLPSSITSPWSASDIDGDLAVCHGVPGRSVSRLDWSTGAVTQRYQWHHQPVAEYSSSAMYMVTESGGGFLVSDECCDMVQRVDSVLRSHQSLLRSQISSQFDPVVQRPRRLCLDSARRLIVGLDDGRIKVFANGCTVM